MDRKRSSFVVTSGVALMALFALAFVSSSPVALAREAESGGGSSSYYTTTPRSDDNPSASDLREGTRIFVPEASEGVSGFDSPRDLFERDLSFGMTSDDDVARLQRALQKEGFLRVAPTGNFWEMTREAVMEFQKEHGVLATGFVGPLTRAELNHRSGDDGEDIDDAKNTGTTSVSLTELGKELQDLMEQVRQLQIAVHNQTTMR